MRTKPVKGCLLAISNSGDAGCFLGLVVDQEAGKELADMDPVFNYMPNPNELHQFVLVRIIGLKLTNGEALSRGSLDLHEPNKTETVRWAFAQINQSWCVAGPDVNSVDEFLRQCRVYNRLGMKGATFLHELELITEYLRGEERTEDNTSYFEKQYFAMLKKILPK